MSHSNHVPKERTPLGATTISIKEQALSLVHLFLDTTSSDSFVGSSVVVERVSRACENRHVKEELIKTLRCIADDIEANYPWAEDRVDKILESIKARQSDPLSGERRGWVIACTENPFSADIICVYNRKDAAQCHCDHMNATKHARHVVLDCRYASAPE